jgi:hypothetical protein
MKRSLNIIPSYVTTSLYFLIYYISNTNLGHEITEREATPTPVHTRF